MTARIPSIEQLTQNAASLLQQSLAQAAQAASPEVLTPRDLQLARSNTQALSFVQAVGLHGVYRYLRDFVARQAVPIFAVGDMLDGWLQTYGLTRKSAQPAVGLLAGTGVAGTVLAAGSLLQAANGQQYRSVTNEVVSSAGAITVAVAAILPGAAGNVDAGAALGLVSPVAGINSGFVAPGGLASGVDAETDTQAIYRLQQRLANEPMGGSPADYARWALAVPGITRAWGLRNPHGPTTAGVIIMADGNAGNYGLPTDLQKAAVYAYIQDPRRGPPDELFVITPVPNVISLTLRLTPDTPAVRTAVQAALAEVFFREAVPGGSIPLSHLHEAMSATAGEYNHALLAPALADGSLLQAGGFDRLLVLGAVQFV